MKKSFYCALVKKNKKNFIRNNKLKKPQIIVTVWTHIFYLFFTPDH
jgi:hypothetical protein